MKAVILAGGYGTRLSEETSVRPKPMVEIGGKPMLWHIMKVYSHYGVNDFIICCGYKGHVIKEYFANYFLTHADVCFDFQANGMKVLNNGAEPWSVTVVDTGEHTMTGGRLKRVRDIVGDQPFCLTYGDGVSDVDIGKLMDFHRQQNCLATLTAVQPPGRFGVFRLQDNDVHIRSFREKPNGTGAWINGGFFVLEPQVMDYIEGDATVWEQEPLMRLARENGLCAFKHLGFWHPMDTLRDRMTLEALWEQGKAPWRVW